MTPTLQNPRVCEERLTVIVGDTKQMKLLGVPNFLKGPDQSCKEIIAELTMNLMNKWNCSDHIVNITSDITSSNTSHLTAACIAIQDRLKRAVLWSGCRHHIGEVLLTHVFNDLKIEASKSPDVTLFTRLRSNWELMSHYSENILPFRSADNDMQAQELLKLMKDEAVARATEDVEYLRDDYCEFSVVSLLYLSASKGDVTFRRPGAQHKARWMAKLIDSLKIALCEAQIAELPSGAITTRQQGPKIRAFATFVTYVYVAWWLTCKNSVDAPWSDLQIYSAY